jgi:capsular exopolysaccharide synthesis family protein
MELHDYVRLVRKGWATLVVAVILAIGGGVAFLLTQPHLYQSGAQLFVSVKTLDQESAGEIVQGSSAAQLKVKSYLEVVRSSRVLRPVIEELGLKTTPTALGRSITAQAPANTVLIDISVRNADPVLARRIANSVTKNFIEVITTKIEAPTTGDMSPVAIDVIEPAVTPTSPVSPQPGVALPVSAVLGAALGMGILILRRLLDTRMHGKVDVEALTDAPVIGGIHFDPSASSRPLIVQADPRSPRAESFRALRTNLQFLDIGASERSFVVTSALPSEGKSTTTANLAIAIAETGASVILVDGDLRRPRLAEVMGIDGTVGLTDALIGNAELDDLIQPWGRQQLSVLPAGAEPPNPSELLGSLGMHALIAELSEKFDYVLVDAPPLLPVTDAAVISRLVRGAIVVSAVKRASRAQFSEAIELLHKVEARVLGVVLTMLPERDSTGYGSYTAYYGRATHTPKRDDAAPTPVVAPIIRQLEKPRQRTVATR